MYTYSFEKLEVWQLSRKLVKEIYTITSVFPDEEKFGLVNQTRRSAISIASNLAEGSSRNSSKDKANFSQIAYTSLMELLNQLIIAVDLGYLIEDILANLRLLIDEIANKINALRKSQLKNV
ncbi:hypothetical protein ES705_28937 [subsurface metagenome]